jgi:hypothetical protein
MNEQETHFLAQLQNLANSIHPDSEFVSRLEDQLLRESRTPPERRLRFHFKLQQLVVLAATLMLISPALLVSPTLRSMAQDILDFFDRDDNDTFPVTPLAPEVVEAPSDIDAELVDSSVSVADAENILGFDILIPAELPSGYALVGAQPSPETSSASLIFSHPPGRALIINQWTVSSEVNDDSSTWGKIAQSANVQIVIIHGVRGEYVEGGWAIFPGADEAQWLPESPQRRLRWREGGMMFEITTMGGSGDDAGAPGYSYVGQQEMIALAESMH